MRDKFTASPDSISPSLTFLFILGGWNFLSSGSEAERRILDRRAWQGSQFKFTLGCVGKPQNALRSADTLLKSLLRL
jgi:hypothetical protein